jgi:hypothetical protein
MNVLLLNHRIVNVGNHERELSDLVFAACVAGRCMAVRRTASDVRRRMVPYVDRVRMHVVRFS